MGSFSEKKESSLVGSEPRHEANTFKRSSHSGAASRILQLQSAIGNRAVGHLLHQAQSAAVALPTGEGRPLAAALRSQFEERFGEDFRKVRIHTGEHAAESARALDAVAYASGSDIVFDSGKFNPETKEGEHLLAHELAHVVQQSRGGAAPQSFNSSGGMERAAAQAATQFSGGTGAVKVAGASSQGVARQETGSTVWLGTPPLSVQLQQFRERQEQLKELRKTNPSATELDLPPIPRPGTLSPQDMLGFDALRPLPYEPPTEFEQKLESGQPFRHSIGKGVYTINKGDVMQIRDLPTGKIQHYVYRTGQTVTLLDREGNVLTSRGLESPLETPVIDPIDVLLFVADVGPIVAKGLTAGGKEIASVVARNALRQAEGSAVAGTVSRTPVQVSQELMTRYSGRLVDSNNALANIIERARHPSLRVDGRAAANELRGIINVLEEGLGGKAAARVEVVPSSSAGRTPDLIVHFADGTHTRYEMRALTSAPRGYVTPKADLSPGAVARALAEETARRPTSRSQIAQAILDKAKVTPTRPSQLTSPIPGIDPRGTISVNVSSALADRAMIDGAVQGVAPRLGPHVERIEIAYLLPRNLPTDPLTRGVMTYVRQVNGTYFLLP